MRFSVVVALGHTLRTSAKVQLEQAVLEPFSAQLEIEDLAQRADKLSKKSAEKIDGELEEVESELETRAIRDKDLSNEIHIMRAELCSKIGFAQQEKNDCDLFMRKSCPFVAQAPGAQQEENDKVEAMLQISEVPAMPVLVCNKYFRKGEPPVGMSTVGAPAPAVTGAPSPASFAPAPGPAPAELRGLPEQGFDGESVVHADAETQTEDWRREFGPRSGQRSIEEICNGLERNAWCRMHLRYIKKPSSAPGQLTSLAVFVSLALFFSGAL